MFRSEVQESSVCTQSLALQVAVHSADLASARDDMARLEEPVTVAQPQLPDAQSALVTVKGQRNECRRGRGVREQQRGSLEVLLCGVQTPLVDHAPLVDSVRDTLRWVYTVILTCICMRSSPQCEIARPFFALRRPTGSRRPVQRFVRGFFHTDACLQSSEHFSF